MYARGIQDMKSVGIQYLEAIRMIKPNLKGNYRTVHVSFVPDEEIGGKDGMAIFSKSNDFKKLNVGIGFDEGIDIKIEGNQGHGSKFIKFTAVSKLGGIQTNVIPSCFQMSVDIRVTPDDDDKIDTLIKKWENKYSQTKFKYVTSGTSKCTNLKEGSLTSMFISVLKKRNMKYSELIFTGATDARFLREMNIPVIGFSPMINTPVLLHDNDENLNLNVFKSGIDIYADIIKSLIQIS
ncbi:N-acyl-L-amino-acid amidohydrolase [Intoshia linei]|uniref:N-acyl-L-amino-acid amidohydrolase n=1 Tax=Intoshia linei TaxID=1819745 RepID=A0A177BBB2_9BILA|nr:N-acyl-L-amino-acid amidohydrolase [Intoshia linei]